MSTNEKTTNGNVFSVLEIISNYRIPLTLTWFFRGLLLSQEVRILTVFQDSAEFRSCDISRIPPHEDCCVQLHHELFEKPVKAHLYHRSLDNCTFVLSDFCYDLRSWTDRLLDRLQPKSFTRVSSCVNHIRVDGSCLDLNARGIGFLVKKKSYPNDQILPGSNIHMDFALSSKYSWKKLEGTVIHISPISRLLFRIGVLLQPNPNEAIKLEKYNSQRKEEILAELSLAFFRASEPPQVKDLYF